MWGSSPLTRGALHAECLCQWQDGLIPAHAESTHFPALARGWHAAHPRSRGEHGLNERIDHLESGSSPLTRGALNQLTDLSTDRGLIPAHAGSTQVGLDQLCDTQAHPRSRGEHWSPGQSSEQDPGSSPLTRGALSVQWSGAGGVGLIPAHAGSTIGSVEWGWRGGAHPRSRGEHEEVTPFSLVTAGSSPLTRGAPNTRCEIVASTRLIPAHAGSTRDALHRPLWQGAHPRSRGEHSGLLVAHLVLSGSSPLTRGARFRTLLDLTSAGLIPAHAGSTRVRRPVVRRLGAHPRSRGEHQHLR